MPAAQLAYVENDNAIWLEGLRDSLDAYITSGVTITCTAVTKVSDGSGVSGFSSFALTYQSGVTRGDHGDGNWLGTLPAAVSLEEDTAYEATITITGDKTGKFVAPFTARKRTLS